mgnify:CR=1 FL=1|tara:strand:+ start:2474 stop:2653 length:180 start_codon:yes stop_codon:yes gene_type:complete
MNEIDELIEKLTESLEQDKFLDKDLEKAIREYESSGKPIHNRLFFVDEYGNPMPQKKRQ